MSEDSIESVVDDLKMLFLDVDGVLTDGGIILGKDDQEMKKFDVKDGMGVTMAQRAGIEVGIITGRVSEAVRRRSDELEIDQVYQGHFWKDEALEQIVEEQNIEKSEIGYMGDDLLDLPVLKQVGLALAPSDARTEVQEESDYVAEQKGGNGAIREAIEWILTHRGEMKQTVEYYRDGGIADN